MHRRVTGHSGASGGARDRRAGRRPGIGAGSVSDRQYDLYLRFRRPGAATAAMAGRSGKPPVGRRHAWCEGSRIYRGVSRVSRRRTNARPTPAFCPRPVLTARQRPGGGLTGAESGHPATSGRSAQLAGPPRPPWTALRRSRGILRQPTKRRPGSVVEIGRRPAAASRRTRVRRRAPRRAPRPHHARRDQDRIA